MKNNLIKITYRFKISVYKNKNSHLKKEIKNYKKIKLSKIKITKKIII